VARLHADPGVVGGEGRVHLEVKILGGRPRAHHLERADEAEGPAVDVVGGAGHLVVDCGALDAAVRQGAADLGVEHLGRHAMLVARHDGGLREGHDGDVPEPAHRRLRNASRGMSGSPVGRKWRMSSWLPSRSPSGFHTASTRMPMRTSSGLHSWMSAWMEMSAPSSAIEATT